MDEDRDLEEVLENSGGDWDERDVSGGVGIEVVEEDGEFSIGDTMLARGEHKEVWREKDDLEDRAGGLERDWDSEDEFEEEEEEDDGFSYEEMGGESSDFYDVSGDDLYGVANSFAYEEMGGSSGDVYAPKRSNNNGYEVGGMGTNYAVVGGGMNAYGVGERKKKREGGTYFAGPKKRKDRESLYRVEGRKEKKVRSDSGLESLNRPKRRGRPKRVSLY
jgi:hypothetical protein